MCSAHLDVAFLPKVYTHACTCHANLQSHHTGTNANSNKHVQTNGEIAKGEDASHGGTVDSETVISASGLGSTATNRSSGGGNLLVSVACGSERGGARRISAARGGLSRAVKVTGSAGLVLLGVVGVQDVSQLSLVVAHAVSTIYTSRGVCVDASAHIGRLGADEGEDVAKLLGRKVGLGNAGSGLGHAVAELLVGRGGQNTVRSPVVGQLGAGVHLA